MKASLYSYKTLRDSPKDAELISHKLMLKANMIKQVASGIYSWLPMGNRVLKNIEDIIKEEMNEAGCLEIRMPLVQPRDLWIESGRHDAYGPELLGFKDRNERDFYLGPTHEEVVTDIARKEINSLKDLPLILYQIQNKFRDEIRPRFGVMRAREFLMKDAYSFDLDVTSMKQTYLKMKNVYKKIFDKLELNYRIVKADPGEIGGSESEEFHVLADSGEDLLAFSNESEFAINAELLDIPEDKIEGMKSPDGIGTLSLKRGIEVGQIFQLGTKYSSSMGLKIQDKNELKLIEMGCYGIGVSRIVAAAIEQNYDNEGIIFPKRLSPFDCILISINPKKSDKTRKNSDLIYEQLKNNNIDVFYDDRDSSPGVKFSDANLMGVPIQIIVSEKNIEKSTLEIIHRRGLKKEEIKSSELLSIFN